jgi:hypothetical protein
VQQDCGALFFRQLFYRVADHLGTRLLDQVLLDIGMLIGDIERPVIAVFGIGRERRVQGNLRTLMARVANVVER